MRLNLNTLAKANGLNHAVQGAVGKTLHKQGITTEAAQQVVARFVEEHHQPGVGHPPVHRGAKRCGPERQVHQRCDEGHIQVG